MPNKQKKIWVISGTHWDREWRYTSDQSLLRLAEIIDSLLDILENNPEFKCFHLDGGTIVIEDYLAVRPENEERLRRLFEDGRLATVPWYTLPEMNTVAPESLIRNLLVGKKMAEKYGGALKTGYTATSYGQISQLPQIYKGLGLIAAMTYRGTNKHQVPPVCHWEGADGTRIHHIRCFDEVTRTNWFFFAHYELVLGKQARDLRIEYDPANLPVHMADEILYETAFQLLHEDYSFNDKPEKLRSAVRHLANQAEPQAIEGNLLGLDMEDNAVPYSNLPKMIKAINKAQRKYKVILAHLDDYVENVLKDIKGKKIPVLKGEMRYTAIEAGFNSLLGATHSSRVILKLQNHEAETELISVAEPLNTLSSMLGGEYYKSLLERAWLKLLKNHAHDSICGSAIDEAHKDMLSRFRAVRVIAREVSRKSCEHIWSKLDTSKKFQEGDLTITFFNPLPVKRKEVVNTIIDTPITDFGDIYIEPCSGAGPIFEDIDIDELITYNYFDIIDDKGHKVPYHVLEKEDLTIEAERKLDSNAIVYNLVRHRILIDVEIPPMGYRTYALRPRKREYITDPKPGSDRPLIAAPDGVLENEFIKVKINSNGTFDLTDKKRKTTLSEQHYFADNGSLGNTHLYKTPLRDSTETSLGCPAKITLVESNKLRGTWKIELKMDIPANADLDGRNRSSEMIELPITYWITLSKGSQQVKIKTKFNNQARDHRLRVMFPTDIKTNSVDVHTPFDVVRRDVRWDVTAENHEGNYPFKPMMNFVDLTDGKRGFSFISKGLREYEVVDDPRRTLAITLMRAHRAYMLANRSLMTPEEYERNTGQHSIGELEMEYAVMVHSGDWRQGNIMNHAYEFNTPWRIIQGVPKSGELPVSDSVISIQPDDKVHLSAFYKNENGYILRIWNSSDNQVTASIKTKLKISSIEKVRMDESEVIENIPKTGREWRISLRAKEITTLRIDLK